MQQAAGASAGGGMLGDELGRQLVVELGDPHAAIIISGSSRAGMAEPVDAADSKSAGGDTMRVRVSLPAPARVQKRLSLRASSLDTAGGGAWAFRGIGRGRGRCWSSA